MQGNFCVYQISEEDEVLTAPGKSTKSSTAGEVAGNDERQGDDDDDDDKEEVKVENKQKLSVGLPSNYPIEVKVMVYIIRVRLHRIFILVIGCRVIYLFTFNSRLEAHAMIYNGNKKHLNNVGSIRHSEPPHAALPFTRCR